MNDFPDTTSITPRRDRQRGLDQSSRSLAEDAPGLLGSVLCRSTQGRDDSSINSKKAGKAFLDGAACATNSDAIVDFPCWNEASVDSDLLPHCDEADSTHDDNLSAVFDVGADEAGYSKDGLNDDPPIDEVRGIETGESDAARGSS